MGKLSLLFMRDNLAALNIDSDLQKSETSFDLIFIQYIHRL